MLQFDDSFFSNEERLGFTIETEMKRCWAVELDVLHEVDRVCRKYGIKYSAEFGTLLGAVRHKGFIPWDDDMDIGVLRPDYIRLMEVLPKELPKEFVVNSAYTSDDLTQPLGSVTNRADITVEPTLLAKSYGSPYISGIDIYPLDYVPRDLEMSELQKALYNVLYDVAQQYDNYLETGELEQYIPVIEELMKTELDRKGNLRSQLWKEAERVASMFGEDESDLVAWMPSRVLFEEEKLLPKEWYKDFLYMPYENIEVSVAVGYDEILRLYYGDDYMTPKNIRAAHDYPYYRVQKEWMQAHGLRVP